MPKNTEVGRTKHCAALVEVCACGMRPLCCLPAPGALGRGLPLLHVKGEGPWGGGKGWTAAPGSHLTSLPQLAEVHGVPRGLYDGPVHDVVLSTKAVPTIAASRIAGCASKVPAVPVRNLHQSGFSLSGRWGQGCQWGRAQCGCVCAAPGLGHAALFPGRSTNAATLCSLLTSTPSSLFLHKAIPPSLAVRPCLF